MKINQPQEPLSLKPEDLILDKASAMWVTIPIDLSTRSYVPLPHIFKSRRVPPLFNQSLVLIPPQSV
jgi:hypothetical protein